MASNQNPWRSLLDPFERYTQADIHNYVDEFLQSSQLHTFALHVRRGALLAQNQFDFERWAFRTGQSAPFPGDTNKPPEILPFEREHLRKEQGLRSARSPEVNEDESSGSENKPEDIVRKTESRSSLRQYFYQRITIHFLVACCSLGAAIQGWDETAVNGGMLPSYTVLSCGKL